MSDTPIPQRLCPDCKVPLERAMSRIPLFYSPADLFHDPFWADIYFCPQCGLARVYSYDQRQKQEESEAPTTQAATQSAPPPQPKEPIAGDPWDKPKGKGWNPFRSKD